MSSAAPPPPSLSLFSAQLWKAVGLRPKALNVPRSLFSLPEGPEPQASGVTSQQQPSSSGRGKDREFGGGCRGGVTSSSYSQDAFTQQGRHFPAASPSTSSGKRRRSSNGANKTAQQQKGAGQGGGSCPSQWEKGGILASVLKCEVPRRPRSQASRKAISEAALKNLLQFGMAIVTPPVSSTGSPSSSACTHPGSRVAATEAAVVSPSRSSSPLVSHEDHGVGKAAGKVLRAEIASKVVAAGAVGCERDCHATAGGRGCDVVMEEGASHSAASSQGVFSRDLCSTPQTNGNSPISIF